MGHVIRLTTKNEEELKKVSSDMNEAIEFIIYNRDSLSDNLKVSPKHIERLKRINPTNLESALGIVLDAYFNRTDLDQARLSELQKKEVKSIVQEELWKARGG